MSDLRTHLFYFIAIFLMLGVGMLVGGSFYGPAQVRAQQRSLANLRVQVDGAVQDGRQAKAELSRTEAALDGARPALVKGKLAGRHVVVVQTGDDADAAQSAAAAASDAGASVAATVVLSPKWQTLTDAERAAALSELVSLLAGMANAASPDLQVRGLVTVTGTPTAGAAFIFVGGSADAAVPVLDGALVTQLRQIVPNALTVYAEASGTGASFVPAYQAANVSTVDCIDRPLGQLALPFALRGGSDAGDYGLKSTAHLTVPPSLSAASHE